MKYLIASKLNKWANKLCPEYFENYRNKLREILMLTTFGKVSNPDYDIKLIFEKIGEAQGETCKRCYYKNPQWEVPTNYEWVKVADKQSMARFFINCFDMFPEIKDKEERMREVLRFLDRKVPVGIKGKVKEKTE